jgi:hypothetical protein
MPAETRHLLSQGGSFDPGTAQITWQIAAFDYAEDAILILCALPAARCARNGSSSDGTVSPGREQL